VTLPFGRGARSVSNRVLQLLIEYILLPLLEYCVICHLDHDDTNNAVVEEGGWQGEQSEQSSSSALVTPPTPLDGPI
jgi:hypothetical protein